MLASKPISLPKIAWIAAAIAFVVHLIGNPHYGFFRDELYFIICGFHPAWGYVDQPPVVPLLAAGSQVFGHSLFLLRALPALFAAGSVFVTCLLVAELGGSAFAMATAAMLVFFAPVLMSFGMKVSTDMPGLVLWPLIALVILRIVRGADPRSWLIVGALLGLACQSKYSVIFFAVALLIGLLVVPQRSILFSKWFAYGIFIAIAIELPNALWQYHYGFPMWQLLEAGQHGKNVIVGPALYLVQELLITNIFFTPLLIAGIVALIRNRDARFLGIAYLALIAIMIVMHGKHYYPANVYPIVFAAGAVALESWTTRIAWLRPAAMVAIILAGLVFTPFALPVLSESNLAAYQFGIANALHLSKGTLATEHGKASQIGQDFADMHGWQALTKIVERAYEILPPNEKSQAVIAASNYGEASAIEFFGHDLPPVISGHNNFWLWGTHGATGNVVIDINGDCGGGKMFRTSQLMTRFRAEWITPEEDGIPIMLCTGIKVPLDSVWPQLKNYN